MERAFSHAVPVPMTSGLTSILQPLRKLLTTYFLTKL